MTNTREKILFIAEELIQKVGISAMSYQDISNAVGIKKASIHHHFPKKDDLVHELLNNSSSIYEEKYLMIMQKDISTDKKLEEITNIYATSLKEGKICLIGMLSINTNLIVNNTNELLSNTIEKTEELFSSIFEQGQKDGTLVNKLSARQSASIFLSSLLGLQITSRVDMKIADFEVAVKALIFSWKA